MAVIYPSTFPHSDPSRKTKCFTPSKKMQFFVVLFVPFGGFARKKLQHWKNELFFSSSFLYCRSSFSFSSSSSFFVYNKYFSLYFRVFFILFFSEKAFGGFASRIAIFKSKQKLCVKIVWYFINVYK